MNKQQFLEKLKNENEFFNNLLNKLKITKTQFIKKINDFGNFTLGEVIKIKTFLNLSMDEIINIFYPLVANRNLGGIQ